jgi:RNA polymerase sigma-70 factor (ECF subfamily)
MSPTDSFDVLLAQLRAGENGAAAHIFHRFADQLMVLARSQLQSKLQNKLDPEDVLQSVFRSFFRRFQAGQFDLENWDSLWAVLTVMTLHKSGHLQEYYLAARRDVRREETGTDKAIQALNTLCAREPTPEEAACLTDLLEHMLRDLDEGEHRIITMYLQGYNQTEIGEKVGRAERTVRRTVARARKRLQRLEDESAE